MNIELSTRYKSLFISLLACFALMGGVVTLFSSVLAEAIRQYGWSYTDTGFVMSAPALGFFSASIVAGMLAHRIGPKPVMLAGMAMEVVGLAFFARTPAVPLNVLLYFMIGLGLGTNESLTNYLVVRLETGGKSRLMNLMHSAWCVGAILGPFGVADLVRSELPWEATYTGAAALVFVAIIVLALREFPAPEGRTAKTAGASSGGRTAGEPAAVKREWSSAGVPSGRKFRTGAMLGVFAFTLFVYIGVEKGTYGWLSQYFSVVIGSTAALASATVGIYWLGQFAGRFGLSMLYHGDRQDLVILALSAASLASILALLFTRSIALATAFAFIAGAANSGLFPAIVSLSGRFSGSSRAIGAITASGGFGGLSFPFLVAGVSSAYGFAKGFGTVLYIAIVLVLLAAVIVASTAGLRAKAGASSLR